MALDKLTKIDGGGISTTSDYRVGVITATKFVGPIEGSITATDASFSGNVSIAGTLTYEDVTNVDSVGILTARTNIILGDSIKHLGDENTLISFPANDTITAHTTGSERLRITSGGNVGIGTNSPYNTGLDVRFPLTTVASFTSLANGTQGADVSIIHTKSGITDNDKVGQISFKGGALGNATTYAQIRAIATDISNKKGDIAFYMRNGNNTTGSLIDDERVRITSDGKVGIGTDNPQEILHVLQSGTTAAEFRLENNEGYLLVRADNNIATYGAQQHLFHNRANSTEYLRITSSGNVGIGTNNPQSLLSLYSDADGEELIHFDMGSAADRRGWKFKQGNTGTTSQLVLQADANGKTFYIKSANGTETLMAYAASSGSYVRIPELYISDSIVHTGDTDTKIAFGTNEIDFQAAGSSRLKVSQYATYVQAGHPLAFLSTSGPTPNIKSGGTNNQDLLLTSGTGNPTRIAIAANGNVGINQSNPSTNLDVSGNIKLTAQLMQSMPADFWSTGNTFIELNGVGNLTHMGSYETCLTSNGYRDNNAQWKSYGINGIGGASQIRLNPYGTIIFGTEASKSDGSAHNVTERLRITSDGKIAFNYDTGVSTIADVDIRSNNGIHLRGENGNTNNVNIYLGGSRTNQRKTAIIHDPVGGYCRGDLHFCLENTADLSDVDVTDSKMVIKADGKVGIGSAAPKTDLDIGNNAGGTLTLSCLDDSATTDQLIGKINFNTADPSADGPQNSAIISAHNTQTLGAGGYLRFSTASGVTGGEGADAVERLRIDSSGKVGINSTLPQAYLDIEGDGVLAKFGSTDSSYEALYIKNNQSGYPAITNESSPDTIELRSAGSVQATLDYNNNDTDKFFRVTTNAQGGSGTELFRVQENGSVGIGTATIATNKKLDICNGIVSLQGSGSHDSRIEFVRPNTGSLGWVGIPNWNPDGFYIYVPTATSNEAGASYGDGTWNFFSNGVGPRLKILSSGNVQLTQNIRLESAPNGTWGAGLNIGGNGNAVSSTHGSMVVTNGNLHLDSRDGSYGVYLNWYGGANGTYFGNGSSGQRGRIDGSGNLTLSGSYPGSDLRLKENIQNISGATDTIKSLVGKTFTWKAEAGLDDWKHYGFIAQEVQTVAPDLVKPIGCHYFDEDDKLVDIEATESDEDRKNKGITQSLTVNNEGVTPILVEAMKELIAKVETLEAKVSALEGT